MEVIVKYPNSLTPRRKCLGQSTINRVEEDTENNDKRNTMDNRNNKLMDKKFKGLETAAS
jgi:hypothetical protein